ncbi:MULTISPECIES: hypothetical protein, partial [unclassified Moorena]|uniref:hypothetical protein n=1 Tax=unclassified Moorena TaxID=2683338 RepID=UPI0025F9FBDA
RTDWGSSSRASKLFGIAGGLISMVLHYYSSFPFCQPHHLNAYATLSYGNLAVGHALRTMDGFFFNFIPKIFALVL